MAEIYGLISQIKREAVSIPSNIAAGNSKQIGLDYLQFFKLNQDIIEISHMLNGLINSLQ